MKINMILRSDALEIRGGDSAQVDQYKTYLEAQGYTVRLIPFHVSMTLDRGAVVHIVNIDRPFDFLSSIRAARPRAVVTSSIHHDLEAVRLMRKAGRRQGIRSTIGRFLPESARELLAFGARNALRIKSAADLGRWIASMSWAIPLTAGLWKGVGRALNEIEVVALLAESERLSLMRDTGWHGRNGVIIPNGVPELKYGQSEVDGEREWANRGTDVCVVGRIEPRKRQLEVARAAARHGLRIKFVGPPNPKSARYSEEFESAVAADANLEWTGSLENSQVLEVMQNSRVLLNCSWVEVQSLVDIEATAAGCWVVVGRGGHTAEWLPESTVSIDSHDVDDILRGVANVLKKDSGPSAPSYPYTWEMAAAQLAGVYSKL
jgi:glycosyltransferase involved in cell wall biosynthesis